jgi:hypothetical protein
MARRLGRLLLIVCVALSACTGPSSDETSAEGTPRLWVITGGWFDHLRYEDQALANRLFRRSPSLIVGTYHRRSAEVGGQTPKSFATSFSYASFENFRDIARDAYFARGLDAVMYDPEAWPATPLVEQRDPTHFFGRFNSVAGQYVETIIITPHPNLMTVPGARCGSDGGESVYQALIRCGVMGAAAQHADIVEVQAQQLQSRPDEYHAFVVEATAQSRAANQAVQVIAGLTTAHASPSQMFDAWSSVRDVVDGYYLSIRDDRDVGTAIAFLRLLPAPLVASSSVVAVDISGP